MRLSKVENDLQEARTYQIEQSTMEGQCLQEKAKLLKELEDRLISVEMQLETMVFEDQTCKEMKPNSTSGI